MRIASAILRKVLALYVFCLLVRLRAQTQVDLDLDVDLAKRFVDNEGLVGGLIVCLTSTWQSVS